jgi:flavorubredoxin
MMSVPSTTSSTLTPHRIAADTWLIPHSIPAGPDAFLGVNSMLIRGEQPIIVDTGAPVHRDTWFEQVLSLVEPEDVRWIFISHDDSDHTGNLHELLHLCPNATLIANFFMTERQSVDRPLPLQRMCWMGPGDTLDAGDRRLHLVLPPVFDAPTTRGLYDEKTAVLWAVDAFASMVPDGVCDVGDVPAPMYDATFGLLNSLVSPWHCWLDPSRYRKHCDDIESLGLLAIASAHGPVLTGTAITDGFERVRRLAGAPIVPGPGQSMLDELLAAAVPAQREADGS